MALEHAHFCSCATSRRQYVDLNVEQVFYPLQVANQPQMENLVSKFQPSLVQLRGIDVTFNTEDAIVGLFVVATCVQDVDHLKSFSMLSSIFIK
jgi:hypothetical protein